MKIRIIHLLLATALGFAGYLTLRSKSAGTSANNASKDHSNSPKKYISPVVQPHQSKGLDEAMGTRQDPTALAGENFNEQDLIREARAVAELDLSERGVALAEVFVRMRRDDLTSRLNLANSIPLLLKGDPASQQKIVLLEFSTEHWNSIPAPAEWKKYYAQVLTRIYFEAGTDQESLMQFEDSLEALGSMEARAALAEAKQLFIKQVELEPPEGELDVDLE